MGALVPRARLSVTQIAPASSPLARNSPAPPAAHMEGYAFTVSRHPTRKHRHPCDPTGGICGRGPGQHFCDRGHHCVGHGSPWCTDVTAQGGQQRLCRMFLTGEGCDEGTDGHGVCAGFAGMTRPEALAFGSATTRAALAAESPVRLCSPHHPPDVQLPRQSPMVYHGDGVPGCHEGCHIPCPRLVGSFSSLACGGPSLRQKWRRWGHVWLWCYYALHLQGNSKQHVSCSSSRG